jgi:hypothetical protein
MIARFSGGVLGLFAFTVAAIAGTVVGNPPMAVITRALWALVVFCVLGLVVGMAAQMVIDEYVTRQEAGLRATLTGGEEPGDGTDEGVSAPRATAATE